MAYVDYEYYSKTFEGEPVSEEEFPALARQASDIIDMLSTATPNPGSDLVKQAACYQIEYIRQTGGAAGAVTSESLGSYSVNADLSRARMAFGLPISPLCLAKLETAGLRGRWI